MGAFNNSQIDFDPLTPFQKEVLIGHLLGDGGLYLPIRGINPVLKISRKETDQDYLKWSYQIFNRFCKSKIVYYKTYDKRYHKFYYGIRFSTRSIPEFLPIYYQWYNNNIKCVPRDLIITPLIAAVWFADDGCIIRSKRGNSLQLKLATNSFKKEETQFLAFSLEKILNCSLSVDSTYVEGKEQFIIRGATEAASSFIKYIEKDFSTLHLDRKNKWQDFNFYLKGSNYNLRQYKKISSILLSLNNFSSSSSELQNIYNSKNNLSAALKILYQNNYLTRQMVDRQYYYNLTPNGINFFQSISQLG